MTDVMTVARRKERVAEIDQRLAEIDTEFMGGALTTEARSEWDDLEVEREEHKVAIADAERREKALEKYAAEHNTNGEPTFEDEDESSRSVGLGSEKAQPVRSYRTQSGKRIRDIYDLQEYRKSTSSEEEYRSLIRDGAKRAVERATIPGYGVDEAKAKEAAMRLLQSVDNKRGDLARRFLETGSDLYMRAFGKAVQAGNTGVLTPQEHSALTARAASTADAEGGFAVPFTLDPSVILTSDGSVNPLRQIARVQQITGTTWQGVTSAGITVARSAEAAEASDDAPSLAQPTVTPTRVAAFVPFSIEVDQDWSGLRSEMTMMLQEAKDDEEADSFVVGDGVDPNPNGVVSTLSDSPSRVLTATTSVFASEDVYAVSEALPPRFRSRASWLGNIAAYNAIRQFAAADGHDLWERIGADQPALLLGKRAYEASAMETDLTTTAGRILLYGDFTKFIIVDRVGMNIELVPHLFGTSNNFPTGQRGIYAIWRNSSLVLVENAFRFLELS